MAAFLLRARWNYRKLPELPVKDGPPPDDVTAIIPARNEERNIGRVVASLRGVPVIVVDDASSDRTAAVAREAGAQVIAAPPLAPGLAGKPNACMAGARIAETSWLLFVDADTWYEPGFLPSLIAYARRERLQMASVFLRQECVSVIERAIVPCAFALYFCGVSGSAVDSPSSSEALANGQCLLFDNEAYRFMGGHGAVERSIVEDVELAAIARRHRMRSRVLRAERLGSVRMHEGFRAIWRGFEKNSFRFLLINPLAGLRVILASILLASWLPALVWLAVEEQWIGLALLAPLPVVLLRDWYGSLRRALLAPLGIYLFQAIAVWSMLGTATGRKAVWKGRRV